MKDRKSTTSPGRLLGVLGLVAATALAGCGAANGDDSGDDASDKTVALITPQKAGDNGPTDNLISGLEALENSGWSTTFVAATDPSSFESTLRNLAQSGVSVVVVSFSEFIQPVQTVAPEFPDTKFVHVYADAYDPPLSNVQNITFDTQGPSYLAGVLAATVTKTDVIGFIGGTAIPPLYADYHAYVAGAEATNPAIVVRSAFVGSFGDPVQGQQIAQTMFNNDVDVVLAYAGGSSLGVVKAADQAGARVIYDNAEGPETVKSVIAVASQHYGGAMERQVAAISDGTWQHGPVVAGLADGGTFLEKAQQLTGAPDVDAAFGAVEEAKQKIVDEAITVPFDTTPV